jgi:prepilin-type N-terminal cleavage/methylation domain-containing protein
MPTGRPLRRQAGFSFIEILVVMGIIATLAGLGLVVVTIFQRNRPRQATETTVNKVKGLIDAWKMKFHVYPPMRLKVLAKEANLPEPKMSGQNADNEPIECLYQAFYAPGFGMEAELGEAEYANIDEDKLAQKMTSRGLDLREIVDAYGNPLVYFVNTEYAAAERNPPSYSSKQENSVNPVPYKDPGGGFVNPNSFQIFSMGPDGKPNTDDDIVGW